MKRFEDVINFHGHACPGLALGYRVSLRALKELGNRSEDEELVAIVENNSCAVDAVQEITGCTFGKGNLIFRDYGKQVYTFISRPSGRNVRISVKWENHKESDEEKKYWERYGKGDRSKRILKFIHDQKSMKIRNILDAEDEELLTIKKGRGILPPEAEIYPSINCEACGEKVAEPKARLKNGRIICIPCSEFSVRKI